MDGKQKEMTWPRNPEHGVVRTRWLPLEERDCITNPEIADVYEIECPTCGTYESAAIDS
jgi:hypothetical protein